MILASYNISLASTRNYYKSVYIYSYCKQV